MSASLPHVKPLGAVLLTALCLIANGCERFPGKPGPGPDVPRPDSILDFPTLYKTNCAGCHGVNGRGGVAIALNNPAYAAFAGEDNIRAIITNGVHDHLMPPFGQSAGGMLTAEQVSVLAHGVVSFSSPAGLNPPPYRATLTADPAHGQQAFTASCARCHGANGEGAPGDAKTGEGRLGSIVEPTYLALISDQDLRSITVAGRPDIGMPDWRSDSSQPLSDQQVTDIVAWLASKRSANPGQPYPTPQ